MKNVKRFLPLLLILCFACITMPACSFDTLFNNEPPKSDEELIESRIDSFLTAYNSGDLSAALDCFDTKTRNTYKAAMGITEKIGKAFAGFDINLSDLFGLSVGLASEDDLLSVEILQIDITDEKNASVDVVLSYKDSMDELSDEGIFTMVKEDNDWFIKDLREK